jgi:iron complex outermembrane receptor protein
MFKHSWLFFLVGVLFSNQSLAEKIDSELSELLDLSLNDVTNVKVTSVSKKPEKLFESQAAIYVISSDDIKKSGATTIPDLLRMAPGIQVAQSGSGRWSVSARGFNDQFSNKLLVLMDGRTIYNSMYSGVYWDQQDALLEDIERIEVIRGPGATLWGANAVNGVINIITKNSSDTNGNLLTTSFGDRDKNTTSLRHGGESKSKDLNYRVYGKYFDRGGLVDASGNNVHDSWSGGQGGFRADKIFASGDTLTMQGDIFSDRENVKLNVATLTAPFSINRNDDEEVSTGNFLVRHGHVFDNRSTGTLQAYYDVVSRTGYSTSSQDVRTADIDWQHIFDLTKNNQITWGVGYRNIESTFEPADHFIFTPPYRDQHFFSGFIQDKIQITPKTWSVAIGSKFEHNPFTGFEYQPSIRTSYLISDKQTVWSSVSRAVRIPNRGIDDVSLIVSGTPGGFFHLVGNRDAISEVLTAYETGYRAAPMENVFLDVSVFYNDYDKLSSNIISGLTAQSANEASGRSYGIESAISWNVTKLWKLDLTQSLINIKLDRGIESGVNSEGKTPEKQYGIRSSFEFSPKLQMNNQLFYTSPLDSFGIDSYLRFDSNLIWNAGKGIELSLVGQNLLDNRHSEFGAFLNETQEEVPRTFYAKVKVSF